MKTLTKHYQPDHSGRQQPVATVELDLDDLRALGVVKDGYNSAEFNGDPAAAMKKLLGRERETLRKIIDEAGATEIVRASLKRLDDYFIARGKLAPIPESEKEAKSA